MTPPVASEELELPFLLGEDEEASEESGPVTTLSFADRLIARMQPWNTGPVLDGATDLERYLRAIAVMFEPLLAIAEETGSDGEDGYIPGYGKLFDPDECPVAWLPYLGRFVGVTIPTGAGETEARALIKAESGFARGTVGAVRSAIRRSLTVPEGTEPDTQYELYERTPSPLMPSVASYGSSRVLYATYAAAKAAISTYSKAFAEVPDAFQATIIVRPEQLTPAGNVTALAANVTAVKPAGIVMHYEQYGTYESAHLLYSTYKAAKEAFSTYAKARAEI